jgi:hypothetical protein
VVNLADIISKIKILEELARLGVDDEVFINAIHKLTQYKVDEFQRDLEDIQGNLKKFEEKYGFESKEFIERFESGEMGDKIDFIEWASLYDMQQRVKERLNVVEGDLNEPKLFF